MADWITVATYLLAALLSALAATEASRRVETREQTFWSASSFMLVLLGINELLDLQTLLTSVGRAHARSNDWYQHRRDVQLAFVISLAVIVAMAGLAMLWLTRRTHPAVRLAQAGLAFVVVYVLIRAASFHHVGEIVGRGLPDFNMGSSQELAGIAIVVAAALLYIRRRQGTS